MTGLELKVKRVGHRVKVMDLAAQMGVSPSRVSIIENQASVTEDTEQRYLAALTTLTTIPTPQTVDTGASAA
jgi:plasmid maintenance system antidote protein VapI